MKINYKKEHGRFSGTSYIVWRYSTTNNGFDMEGRFKVYYTAWLNSIAVESHRGREPPG